ncbi:MAG: hypothetical protein O9286_14470 [Aquidulcibacter sp.]|uniref:hypothetical protein n=1 Tax=Aquidulcibacter sp. TaxID=2052990 RepID=UPI0022C1B7C9|nr:hypothetical protein [Aquidulcibacter sp.]
MANAFRILAAFTLLLAFPVNLAAQGVGQTPETAQAFLTKVFAAGGVQVTGKSVQHDYGVSRGDFSGAIVNFPMATATSWKHYPQQDGASCTSEIGVYAKYGERRSNRTGGTEIVRNSVWSFFGFKEHPVAGTEDYAFQNGSGVLLWKDVIAVQINGTDVTLPINYTYSFGGIRFRFPTEDLAKRAGFAMEVIRLACDATADANF